MFVRDTCHGIILHIVAILYIYLPHLVNDMNKYSLATLLLCSFSVLVNAQNIYQVPYSGEEVVITGSGTVTDHAEEQDYAANADGVLIIKPDTVGKYIRITFSEFDVEGAYDYLAIYSGDSVKPSLLVSQYADNPGTITSYHPSGAITLKFNSNYQYQSLGFKADISCIWRNDPVDIASTITLGNVVNGMSHAVPGNTLSAVSNLKNTTTFTTLSSVSAYYLSTDTSWDASDVMLDSLPVPIMLGKQTYINGVTLNIPASTIPGIYYVLYVADIYNMLNETTKANNLAYDKVSIQPGLADLKLTQTIFMRKGEGQGDTMSVNCTISNIGYTAAPSTTVGYYISTDSVWDVSDVLAGGSAVGNMPLNQSYAIQGVVNLPPAIPFGVYYLISKADHQLLIAEGNEANNYKHIVFEVFPAGVDLEVTITSTDVPIASIGTPAIYPVKIRNRGAGTMPPSQLAIYLSLDQVWDASDIQLGNVGTLSAYTSGLESVSQIGANIPAGTANGLYYMICRFDYNNQIAELSEANNMVVAPVEVVTAQADLTFIAKSLSVDSVWPGTTLTAYSTVKNVGTAITYIANVAFYLSDDTILSGNDVLLDTVGGWGIQPATFVQRIKTLAIPMGTIVGPKYILYIADYDNMVAERNEGDNIVYAPVRIMGGTLDLQISNATFATSAIAGVTYIARYTATNTGTGKYLPGTTSRAIYLSTDSIYDNSDLLLDSIRMNSTLSPGASANLTNGIIIAVNTPPGNYFLITYLDQNNTLSELSEVNNIAAVPFTLMAPYTDLMPLYSFAATYPVPAGQPISLTGKVKNEGNVSAGFSRLGYYLSADTLLDAGDLLLDSASIFSLSPQALVLATQAPILPANLAPGQHYILFCADFRNGLSELNETNNVAYRAITVFTPTYDFEPLNPINMLPDTANNAQVVNVQVRVQNNGTFIPAKVSVVLSNDTIGDAGDTSLYTYNILNAAFFDGPTFGYINATVTIPAAATQGHKYILAQVDRNNEITEVNEVNNTVYKPIFIRSIVRDIVVSDITMATHVLYSNDTTTVTAKITNAGNVPENNVAITFHLRSDTTILLPGGNLVYNTAVSLAAGQSQLVSFTFSMSPGYPYGDHYIFAVADRFNLISEANEQNNQAFTSLSKPDTFFTDITLANIYVDDTIYMEDSMSFGYTLLNNGNENTEAFTVVALLSANCTFESPIDDIIRGLTYQQMPHDTSYNISAKGLVPSGFLQPGNYQFMLYADFGEDLDESNETNNIFCRNIVLLPQRRADVFIATTNIATNIYTDANATVNYSVVIGNSGQLTSFAPSLEVLLSTDSLESLEDITLDDILLSALAVGDTINYTGSVALPGVAQGIYYIIFKATSEQQENYYRNNTRAHKIGVDLTTGMEALRVASITLVPNPAAERISIVIKTTEQLQMPYMIYSTDGKKCMEGVSQLQAGENTVSLSVYHLPEGLYTFHTATGYNCKFIIKR